MPADSVRLAIVIPVYNRREHTRGCLQCLGRQTHRDFEVIVVDDGSSDGTAEMVRREFPAATLLQGDGTLWWTGATNRGAGYALSRGATHLLCLNDDTLPREDFVERLLETAGQNPYTIVGAFTIDARTGEPTFGGEKVHWLTAGVESLLDRPFPARLVEVTHAPGRGLLVPALVFARIGEFDARHFPQYAADYDFTHRARRAGFRIVCDRQAVLGMFPEASGDSIGRRTKSWTNYRRHLFDVRGGGNLRVFFWFAVRNCPLLLLPACLAMGWLRRLTGYPLEWIRERWIRTRINDADQPL